MDATMNYLFAKATVKFFINRKQRISGRAFAQELTHLVQRYGEAAYLLWNLMDSHDTDRLPSMILNPDRPYDKLAGPRDNPAYDVRKPGKMARTIQKQIAVFQMTFVGSPLIYYGDEAGMWGADDPDDRKPMVWPEFTFEPERHHPLPGHQRPVDPNGFDPELFRFYQQIIAIRHKFPALQNGAFTAIAEATGETTLGFTRTTDQQQVVALFNNHSEPVQVVIKSASLTFSRYQDIFTNKEMNTPLKVTIPPHGYRLLVNTH